MLVRVLLLIVISSTLVKAQVQFTFNSGIGTYKMNDMKTFQSYLRSSLPVNAPVTSSFPSYWFYEFNMKQKFENKLLLGGAFSYGSTGGRIYYSDYSGSLWYDQLLSYYSFSCIFGKSFSLNSRFSLDTDLRPGITVTNLKITGNEILGSTSDSFHSTFRSVNLTLQPTVTLAGKFGPVTLNTFAGYNIALAMGELQTSDFGGGTLTTGNNQKAHADWSGLRLGGGISFSLKEKTPTTADKISWGIGGGLDYGGFGVNLLGYAHKNVGFFIGTGYALAGMGYNGGIKLRLTGSELKSHPYLLAMYGYNAAVVVTNAPSNNKLFYGPSLGMGVDLQQREGKPGYWNFGLLIPIRSPDVDNYITSLKSQGVQFNKQLPPIGFSVGYRFMLN